MHARGRLAFKPLFAFRTLSNYRCYPTVIEGKAFADSITERVKAGVKHLKDEHNVVPKLAIISAGEDPASQVYIALKMKACQQVGIEVFQKEVDIHHEEELVKLEHLVHEYSLDPTITGVMIQLPILDKQGKLIRNAHCKAVDLLRQNNVLHKDVDGLHPCSQTLAENVEFVGSLLESEPSTTTSRAILNKALHHLPCTPIGVMELLKFHNVDINNKHVCVIGRSTIVGMPVITSLLRHYSVTVTTPHYTDSKLAEYTRLADVIIVAAGSPSLIKTSMLKENAILVDIGINRVPCSKSKNGYKLIGDIDPTCYPLSSAYTPVPGGIGPVTVSVLLNNTLNGALVAHKISLPF